MKRILLAGLLITTNLTFAQVADRGQVSSWITTSDRSKLFQKESQTISFHPRPEEQRALPVIIVDPRQEMQSVDGFGFALTGGSAELLMKMSSEARAKTLLHLFSPDGDSAGVSYLRLTIGASDMNAFVYSYDDLAKGKTDPELKNFDLGHDKENVIPVLKEILRINPTIKILASSWSAPAWMKTNDDPRGGALKEEDYPAYAKYLIRYIGEMKKEGVVIDAISIQNEPLNNRNTPSMRWLVDQQRSFLKEDLIPAFTKSGLKTKLVLFDHNLNRPDYPLTLLSEPAISEFADGTGFHNYGGDVSAMGMVHAARPDKNVYFTEQTVTEKPGSPTIDIAATVERLIINTTRNWSKNVILWNMAADPNNEPHTDNGGCSGCQGAITLDKNIVSFNLAYYTVVHASKFVRPGSIRIASTAPGDQAIDLTTDEERPEIKRVDVIEHSKVFPNVAFKTPDGKIVLIVANTSQDAGSFLIQYNGQIAAVTLSSGAVGTYVW